MSEYVFPTAYQQFIHLSRYARWDDGLGRRETFPETTDRYLAFFNTWLRERHDARDLEQVMTDVRAEVLSLGVMPSMRCMMTAGRALARDNAAGFNCSYRAVDDARAFDETLYVLMCGTGVGFSVERQFVNRLPVVPEVLEPSETVIIVRDSKRGWAEALRELVAMLYSGRVPRWDTSKVRPKGARLKTMGGRASGPEPLVDLFHKVIRVFEGARGRRLSSVECHDVMCMIGDCVVVGGVRRSAMLSLSNLSDQRMRDAKAGNWFAPDQQPWRSLANNSVAYTERPEVGQFMAEWLSLYDSKSGERGVFNREAVRRRAAEIGRRIYWDEKREQPIDFGTNPCGEIVLRSRQFCNLSEVVARPGDSVDDLMRKVALATVLGTWQSTLTDFRYLTSAWRANTEEERLLGVSLTGIMDHPVLSDAGSPELPDLLRYLRNVAHTTNREWAEQLGIPPSAALTCVKPSGTVSQLVNSSSGIHPRYAPAYVRRVRQDAKDPLTHFMIDHGFPHEMDAMKKDHVVFDFPVRSPEGSTCTDDVTAVEQLGHWRMFQQHWCDHNPSVTVTVRESEWPSVGGWVWDHFDDMSGVSFLPSAGNHVYRQAPYEAVSDDTLAEMGGRMPRDVDWSKLGEYERDGDAMVGTREYACSAGQCDI